MEFIIQYNMLPNDILMKVKDAVKDMAHRFVGLIPFSREITSDEPLSGQDYIPYGSTSFVETAQELGWKGLSFDAGNFNYQTFCNNRQDMLNAGRILKCEHAINFLEKFPDDRKIFMRPSNDLKQFSGSVFTAKEARDFLSNAIDCGSSAYNKLDKSSPIVLADNAHIIVEYRWFIVGGQVIDGSMYRYHGELVKKHVTCDDLYKEIQHIANKWLPNQCCVMDTCITGNLEPKIVEFNCINGSGFYDHDVNKIMKAWSDYYK